MSNSNIRPPRTPSRQKQHAGKSNRKFPPRSPPRDTYLANKVVYDSADHWAVLTQMHGSVWPKVFGYCVFNVINTLFVTYMKKEYQIDLSFSDKGHTFMSMMVSFLMVTRSNIAYSRYMEARTELAHAMAACRELISYATTFTRYDKSEGAKHWRVDLAKRTIKLLCVTVSVLEYQCTGNHAWKVPALSSEEKQALQVAVGTSNERAPMFLGMFLRSTIAANVNYLEEPLHPVRELKLYSLVSDFVTSYHGLMKLVTTPFPFPLVQMTRTFLFIWIFTLPWVLVNDLHKLPALVFTVFFITYAFVGLEFVAIELDDPFGDDPNDFDVYGLATVTFKDIYIFIFDLHGEKDSKELLDFVHESNYKSENFANGIDYRINDGRNALTKSKSSRHQRMSSCDAWKLSAILPPRREAGSEGSRFLLHEQNKEFDRIETSIISTIGGYSNNYQESLDRPLPYPQRSQQRDNKNDYDSRGVNSYGSVHNPH